MKFVPKGQAKKFQNSAACSAFEYAMEDADINGAVIELSGRYPDKDRTVNTECKELGYVISGSGRVVVENKEVSLAPGDLVLIEPGEKFFWEGEMTLFMPCAPAWRPEQHKEVE